SGGERRGSDGPFVCGSDSISTLRMDSDRSPGRDPSAETSSGTTGTTEQDGAPEAPHVDPFRGQKPSKVLSMNGSSAPVAVFAYNRVDHLRRTLSALERNHGFFEAPVVVFSDGPKTSADE